MCMKKGYMTRKIAKSALKRLRKTDKKFEDLKNVYLCPDCGLYHMTRWDKKKMESLNKKLKTNGDATDSFSRSEVKFWRKQKGNIK